MALFQSRVPSQWKDAIRTFCFWQCLPAEYGPIYSPPSAASPYSSSSSSSDDDDARETLLLAGLGMQYSHRMSISDQHQQQEEDEEDFYQMPAELDVPRKLTLSIEAEFTEDAAELMLRRKALRKRIWASLLDATLDAKDYFANDLFAVSSSSISAAASTTPTQGSRVRGRFVRVDDIPYSSARGSMAVYKVVAALDDRLVEVEMGCYLGSLQQARS